MGLYVYVCMYVCMYVRTYDTHTCVHILATSCECILKGHDNTRRYWTRGMC